MRGVNSLTFAPAVKICHPNNRLSPNTASEPLRPCTRAGSIWSPLKMGVSGIGSAAAPRASHSPSPPTDLPDRCKSFDVAAIAHPVRAENCCAKTTMTWVVQSSRKKQTALPPPLARSASTVRWMRRVASRAIAYEASGNRTSCLPSPGGPARREGQTEQATPLSHMLSAPNRFARRAIHAYLRCRFCPSCQSAASPCACSVGQINSIVSRIPPR
jgi:hypothetical protein